MPIHPPRVLALAFLALAASCTFPSVSYKDAGAGGQSGIGGASHAASTSPASSSAASSGGSGACTVPSKCGKPAGDCAQTAKDHRASCLQQCQGEPSCASSCDAAQSSSFQSCITDCETCAASTCGGAATNCGALVSG